MPRNIEIKARIDSVETVAPRAAALAAAAPTALRQDDTFFVVAGGRLKLREFADGSAELIQYRRADCEGPRASDYVRAPVLDAASLREALTRACGQLGRVRKQRLLWRLGATRIHLDRVDGLGDFVELEVVLRDGQDDQEGVAEVERLLAALGLQQAPRIANAYLDLLADAARPAPPRTDR